MGDLGNHHPYKDYNRKYQFSLSQIAGDATTTVVSNIIQLTANPSRMFVCVRLPVTTPNYWAYTKSYLPISNVQITYANKGGILSTANQYQLYQLSKKNNSKQTWEEFSGFVPINDAATGGVSLAPSIGSLLILKPTLDFGLPESIANNSLGQYNLSIRLTVTNQFPYAITPELFILCEYDGNIYLKDGVGIDTISNVNQELVFQTKDSNREMPKDELNHLSGGSITGKIGLVRRFLGRLGTPKPMVSSSAGSIVGAGRKPENRLKNLCQ
jgi:hypothetical protein